MNVSKGQNHYVTAVFVCMSVLLAGVLYWELDQGRRLEQDLVKMRKIPVTQVTLKPILPEFNLPSIESGFPELVSRSLFATNRRSSTSASKGGKSAMKKGQFVLVGVLVTPMQKSALLRDVQTNRTETLAQNAEVRGLTLAEVNPTRVVLRQGVEIEELILNVQVGPKGTAAPSPPPAFSVPTPAIAKTPVVPASAASAPALSAPPKLADVASAPKGPLPAQADAKKTP